MTKPYYESGVLRSPRLLQMEDRATEQNRQFYRAHHQMHTMEYADELLKGPLSLRWKKMTAWEMMEWLLGYVDPSDPNFDATQIVHGIQVLDSMKREGLPRWCQAIGLWHDAPKILAAQNVPHEANVGDTFVLGMPFSDLNLFPEYFEGNPDLGDSRYQSGVLGIYQEGCGLRNVRVTPGHDEYGARILRRHHERGLMRAEFPEAAFYMLQFHSLYGWFHELDPALLALMDAEDRKALRWVQLMARHDYYSKSSVMPTLDTVLPSTAPQTVGEYAKELIEEFFGTEPMEV